MAKEFIENVKEWALKDRNIESVIIVGSYARGTQKDSSDLDLCIITLNKNEMIENQNFIKIFGDVVKKQTEFYGECTSIRVWYRNGQEIEFGIVEPSWIAVPMDVGTQKVLNDGYKVILDKKHYFQELDFMRIK